MAIDWTALTQQVMTIINTGAPVVEELVPAWAPAIQITTKILAGAADAEPTAQSLLQTIQSGTPPTPTQLQTFASAYEVDYQTLHADIAAQLAVTPA